MPAEAGPWVNGTCALSQSVQGMPQERESGSIAPAQNAAWKPPALNFLRKTRLWLVPSHNHPSKAARELLLAAKKDSPGKGWRVFPGGPNSGSVTGAHVCPPSCATRIRKVK